jgi:hypothetical protein
MHSRARICKHFKQPRNRSRTWRAGMTRQAYFTYRPARLHRLAGIDFLESIPGLLKRLQIHAQR